MKFDYGRLAIIASRGYAAWLVTCGEVGARAMRASAGDAAEVASATADALRAPEAERGAAVDRALQCAFDAQRRRLHLIRGMSPLLAMTALNHFDATRPGQPKV